MGLLTAILEATGLVSVKHVKWVLFAERKYKQ